MTDFLEGLVTLLPVEAGGRSSAISPREGSYRPFAVTSAGVRLRIRVIEGPPAIWPGQQGRVVAEVETVVLDPVMAGTDFDLIEHARCVGILTVTRLWRVVAGSQQAAAS